MGLACHSCNNACTFLLSHGTCLAWKNPAKAQKNRQKGTPGPGEDHDDREDDDEQRNGGGGGANQEGAAGGGGGVASTVPGQEGAAGLTTAPAPAMFLCHILTATDLWRWTSPLATPKFQATLLVVPPNSTSGSVKHRKLKECSAPGHFGNEKSFAAAAK